LRFSSGHLWGGSTKIPTGQPLRDGWCDRWITTREQRFQRCSFGMLSRTNARHAYVTKAKPAVQSASPDKSNNNGGVTYGEF